VQSDRVALQVIRLRRRRRWPTVDGMSASHILISSGSDFESAVGYSRAVRVGPYIAVAGTTGPGPAEAQLPTSPPRRSAAGGAPTPGRTGPHRQRAHDIGAQTREALRRIEIALGQAGATLHDVIRTRIYVTDISRWREVAAVHSEVFGEIRPAATMVEVAALIAPDLLVEIEADAYVTR
jgi:enamine deaminase RidA (YjgF/YER057c/UK114 family)